jgi:hypothetical protein
VNGGVPVAVAVELPSQQVVQEASLEETDTLQFWEAACRFIRRAIVVARRFIPEKVGFYKCKNKKPSVLWRDGFKEE